jgi:hypothetical protein
MFSKLRKPIAALVLAGCGLSIGCGGGNRPVKPRPAEPVPVDAPVGEEKPSTDEK